VNVVTFVDYLPTPRFDGEPWAKVSIEESVDQDGPWTEIEEITFPDPDADPENPKPRSFTTDQATLDEGWYRVTFKDVSGDTALPTEPVHHRIDPPFYPSVTDVAVLIRARTKNQFGVELGTFTDSTRPSGAEVHSIIQQAATDVTGAVGEDFPDAFTDEVEALIALGAAMRIELSYYPEQVRSGRSPYPELKELYDGKLAALLLSMEGGTEPTAESALAPKWSFHDNGLAGAQRW